MPIQRIATFPDEGQFSEQVVLGDTTYRLRFTYRTRQSAWYLDVYAEDGSAIRLGRRLNVKTLPMAGVVGSGMNGILYVPGGPERYVQADLGERLLLFYVPADDLPDADVDPLAPTIDIT